MINVRDPEASISWSPGFRRPCHARNLAEPGVPKQEAQDTGGSGQPRRQSANFSDSTWVRICDRVLLWTWSAHRSRCSVGENRSQAFRGTAL